MLVDSCVWIDLFNGRANPHVAVLQEALQRTRSPVLLSDLTRFEVLRGYPNERRAAPVMTLFSALPTVALKGPASIGQAIDLDRALQRRGWRMSTVDLMIGTWCITERVSLLTRDKAFAWLAEIAGLDLVPAGS